MHPFPQYTKSEHEHKLIKVYLELLEQTFSWDTTFLVVWLFDWLIDLLVVGRYKPRPRPRKGGSVWHYRWIGRFRSPKGRGLGKRLGRVTGRRKIFSCALLARRKRYRAFALRRRGVCYGTFSSRTYTRKPVIKGRFRASAGGFNFIDAYTIGKGATVLEF